MTTLDELRMSPAAVLTVAQAADVLADLDGQKLDERTIRRACEDGQIAHVRVGRRILIARLPLLELLGVSPPDDEGGPLPGPPSA
jgi:excisionase family DNA binding protein